MEGSVSSTSRDAPAQPPAVPLVLGKAVVPAFPKRIPKGRTSFSDLPPEIRNAIIENVFRNRDVVNIELVDHCLSSRAHLYFASAGAQLLRVSRLFNEIGKAVLPSNTVFGIHNQRVWGLQGSECGTSAHALVKHLDVNSRCWTNYTYHYFDWWPQVESINISQISTADLRHVYPNNSDALARMHHIPIFASQKSALYMRMTGLDAEGLSHLTSRVSSILRLPGWSSEEAAKSCRMTASVVLQLEGASAGGIVRILSGDRSADQELINVSSSKSRRTRLSKPLPAPCWHWYGNQTEQLRQTQGYTRSS